MEQTTSHQHETGAVESVVYALHKVIDLLDRIKNAIEESSNKIPKASVQLSTVTEATELATTEILNVLDTMSQTILTIEQRLGELRHHVSSAEGKSKMTDIEHHLGCVSSDTMNITMALQVQDITAQRIAAANHLIESVRVELMNELNYFEGTEVRASGAKKTTFDAKPSGPQVFDHDASFTKSDDRQKQVDRVIQKWRNHELLVPQSSS